MENAVYNETISSELDYLSSRDDSVRKRDGGILREEVEKNHPGMLCMDDLPGESGRYYLKKLVVVEEFVKKQHERKKQLKLEDLRILSMRDEDFHQELFSEEDYVLMQGMKFEKEEQERLT